jgi:ABC-three component (ABC-3C) system Middle Component 6
MLLPEKHLALSESVLGLGAVVLSWLRNKALSLDALHERAQKAAGSADLPTYHGFDSVILAILFLYTVGAVELTEEGDIRRCAY